MTNIDIFKEAHNFVAEKMRSENMKFFRGSLPGEVEGYLKDEGSIFLIRTEEVGQRIIIELLIGEESTDPFVLNKTEDHEYFNRVMKTYTRARNGLYQLSKTISHKEYLDKNITKKWAKQKN